MGFKPEAGKEYRTRGGRKARVYAVDGCKPLPVHGAILTDIGWKTSDWRSDGTVTPAIEVSNDLLPEKKTAYLNMYPPGSPPARMHPRREDADIWQRAGGRRVACVKIEYYEGQFDD